MNCNSVASFRIGLRSFYLFIRTLRLPKLHKRPYKARFIANSSSCTTTELSKLSTSCITAIKAKVIKYCETVYERSGENMFWPIKIRVKYLVN